MSRIPPAVAAAVIERANGQCELSPESMGTLWFRHNGRHVFHHRQARAMGGGKGRQQDTAANLLYLCDRHHRFLHAHPEWSREHGYIVSQYASTP